MAVKVISSPFGSPTRTRVLLVLHLLGESYPRELARILDAPLSVIQKALRSLERDGLVGGRTTGRTRVYRMDPRYFASSELKRFLERLSEPDSDLRARLNQFRRRPRRSGKPL